MEKCGNKTWGKYGGEIGKKKKAEKAGEKKKGEGWGGRGGGWRNKIERNNVKKKRRGSASCDGHGSLTMDVGDKTRDGQKLTFLRLCATGRRTHRLKKNVCEQIGYECSKQLRIADTPWPSHPSPTTGEYQPQMKSSGRSRNRLCYINRCNYSCR